MFRNAGVRFVLFLLVGELALWYLKPPGVTGAAERLLFFGWIPVAAWLSELLPLGVAALWFPLIGVLFDITTAREAFAPFAHPIIFLFLGSFMMARAVEKHDCAHWLSSRFLSSRWSQSSAYRYSLTLALVTFFLSMWLSNTAITAALLPLIPAMARAVPDAQRRGFTRALLLVLAYSASLGGISTPVGTPPNLIALGMLSELAPQIPVPTFLGWMLQALPLALGLLFTLHAYLYRRYLRMLPWHPAALHWHPLRLHLAGRRTLLLFAGLVGAWFVPGLLKITFAGHPGVAWLTAHWPEAIPAVLFGSLLFVVRDGQGRPLLTAADLGHIDWGTLLLFGGGLSFGAMAQKTDLMRQLIASWTGAYHGAWWILAAGLVVFTILATELFSNTAMASLVAPLVITLAVQRDYPVWPLVFATTLACSMAFMLPVATPPNAIVFGTGQLQLRDMVRAGLFANLLAATGLVVTMLVLAHTR